MLTNYQNSMDSDNPWATNAIDSASPCWLLTGWQCP